MDHRDAIVFIFGAASGGLLTSFFLLSAEFPVGEPVEAQGVPIIHRRAERGVGYDDKPIQPPWLTAFLESSDADRDRSGLLDASEVGGAALRFRQLASGLEELAERPLLEGVAAQLLAQELTGEEAPGGLRRKVGHPPGAAFAVGAAKLQAEKAAHPMPLSDEETEGNKRNRGVLAESSERAMLLLCLMLIQSASAMVLSRYEDFLKEHHVVVMFLTMLVGAGGNVGNQSVIQTIEALIRGHVHPDAKGCIESLVRQLSVGATLAAIMGAGGFLRAYMTQYYFRAPGSDGQHALRECTAITIALMVIVVTSAVLGTSMPFGLAAVGLDVVHAGPTIQVVMDIGGVVITCAIAHALLRHPAAAGALPGFQHAAQK